MAFLYLLTTCYRQFKKIGNCPKVNFKSVCSQPKVSHHMALLVAHGVTSDFSVLSQG